MTELRPELFDAIVSDGFDLAAVFDQTGTCQFLNPAGQKLLGVTDPTAIATLTLRSMLILEEQRRLEDEILPHLGAQALWTGQIVLKKTTGVEIPTRSTIRRHDDGCLTLVTRDLTDHKAVMNRIAQRTFYDEVTNLPHRSLFLDKLDLALRRLQDNASPLAVLWINLDRFKEKNDRYGHDVGNLLLRSVAQRLPSALDETLDTLARWGGDEFVVLREPVAGDDDALLLADQIVKAFADPFTVDGNEVFLSASIGIAVSSPGDISFDEMLRHADAACQLAKQKGGDTHHLFDEEMRTRAMRRAEVEDALRGAALRGELVLHFQPEILLRSTRIVATEALIRWQHPEWGLVSPAEFIPVAEASGLIFEIGPYVLDAGMRQCAAWNEQFPERGITVAINLSGRQFREPDFIAAVAQHLHDTKVDPGLICLEITESVLMDNLEEAAVTLRQLKALGVRLAIDDFGTGYSSLSYLRKFPVDILKVDQSFVSGLGHDPEASAIVQAVVSMGRALGLMTVAEGVETAHHVIELRELNCDIAQGYHFARPQPAELITELIALGDEWLTGS